MLISRFNHSTINIHSVNMNTQDQPTQAQSPIKRKCEFLEVNIHKNMHKKRNVVDSEKYELKLIEPIKIILPPHCNPIQTNMNNNHLFDEIPWKNFYDE